jgi:hypothetical protein
MSLTLDPTGGDNLDLVVTSGLTAGCQVDLCAASSTTFQAPETTSLPIAGGATYYVFVEAASPSDAGPFTLQIDCGFNATVEVCNNGADDDGDGLIDCADPNCATSTACVPDEVCSDGLDNDNNGETDCGDQACATAPNCVPENCTDTVDNDGDGNLDCADSDCFLDPACGS